MKQCRSALSASTIALSSSPTTRTPLDRCLMISPTRSRNLVSGGLTALLAALECALEAPTEAVVHAHQLRLRPGGEGVLISWFLRVSGFEQLRPVSGQRRLSRPPFGWRGLR